MKVSGRGWAWNGSERGGWRRQKGIHVNAQRGKMVNSRQQAGGVYTCSATCHHSFLNDHHVPSHLLQAVCFSYKTRLFSFCSNTYPVSSFHIHDSVMKRPADMDLAASPSPSEPESPNTPTSDLAGPPRKRARSDVTPEERREARAHRNRIAAQNSRDRRKAQFSYLERRVQELEEENQQLRAGMGLSQRSRSHEQKDEEREKDRARDQENEELRQRIKTLETGWEAVMKALAASGLPLNVPSAPSSSLSASSSSSPSAVTSGHPPTTTFPVFVPPSPVFPISPASSNHSSGSSTLFDSDDFDTTRHLARVATTDAPRLSSVSLQRVDLNARRIASSWSSTSLHPPIRRPSRSVKAHPRLWTKSRWTISSVRSSRLLPYRRRLLCLLTRPPGHDPSRSPKSSWPRRPPPRR